MKIFVMVDMEGVSGICRKSQVAADGEHYQAGRRLLTRDVNTCVEGCLAGGATRIVVRDAHGSGFNLNWEDLNPGAEYIQGASPLERLPGIAAFDGLILLGYHAMAGTPQGILEHTMSSALWQNFWMNGSKCGEIAIDAGIAGDHGVPTIMVSGDDKVCAEAAALIKGIITCQVKKGLDAEGGQLLPAAVAHQLIRDSAAKAVRACRKIRPFKVKKPVTMRLGRPPAQRPQIRLVDGRTYEVSGPDVESTLRLL